MDNSKEARRQALRAKLNQAFAKKLAESLEYLDTCLDNEDEGHEADFNVGELIKDLENI